MWRLMKGGYQGLMNASDVLAADLRQVTVLEYLDHDTSGPPHPASSIPLWMVASAETMGGGVKYKPSRLTRRFHQSGQYAPSTWATTPTVQ